VALAEDDNALRVTLGDSTWAEGAAWRRRSRHGDVLDRGYFHRLLRSRVLKSAI
jgi:hypothetical protein